MSDAGPTPADAAKVEKPRSVALSVGIGLVLAAIVIGSLVIGPIAFFVFASLVLVLAQAELYTVLKATGRTPAILLGLVCGGVLLVSTWQFGLQGLAVAATLPVPAILAWSLTVPSDEASSLVTSTLLGIFYGPLLAGFAVLILRAENGSALMVTFIGQVAVFDSAAYLFGRKIGRTKMAPVTSPKKSWEGFAAATVTVSVLSAIVVPMLTDLSVIAAVALGLLMSIVGPLGDLAESLVKRDLGVKDMGTLLPGHGGLFDRVDAIIFSAPFAWSVMRLAGIV